MILCELAYICAIKVLLTIHRSSLSLPPTHTSHTLLRSVEHHVNTEFIFTLCLISILICLLRYTKSEIIRFNDKSALSTAVTMLCVCFTGHKSLVIVDESRVKDFLFSFRVFFSSLSLHPSCCWLLASSMSQQKSHTQLTSTSCCCCREWME